MHVSVVVGRKTRPKCTQTCLAAVRDLSQSETDLYFSKTLGGKLLRTVEKKSNQDRTRIRAARPTYIRRFVTHSRSTQTATLGQPKVKAAC